MNDYYMSVLLIVLAGITYYTFYRESKHKEALAFARKKLMVYSFDPDVLKEYGDVLDKLNIEQKISLLYKLFGHDRPIKCFLTVYESGLVLNGIFADEDKLDDKKDKGKSHSYFN